MNKFEDIIKKGVEQFEVPYNEDHWVEMDSRLNTIRATKIRNNILGGIAAIAIVAVSSYFMFSNTEIVINDDNDIATIENSTNENIIKNNVQPIDNKKVFPKIKATVNDNFNVTENTSEENTPIVIKESTIENKTADNNSAQEVKNNKSTKKINSNDNLINAEFIVFNNQVCLGQEVSFESLDNELPVSYTWNFGDGTISHSANPKHLYNESHVFTVTLTLLDRLTGKEYTTIQQDVVTILPTPNADFVYSEESVEYDDNKLKYPYTSFSVKNAVKENSYKWVFENGESLTAPKVKTIYKKGGNFNVTIIATNSYGCSNKSTKKVTIENGSDIYVQNAFRPNSSITENETFIPKVLLEWDVKFEMIIIDNASKVVYKTSDKNEPWNGKMNNVGQLLDQGVYMWQIATYDADGNIHRHQGKINLIR